MLRQMPSRLLTEWMAYHSLEPFGDELLDIHFAELKAAVINVNRAKNAKAVEPKKLRLWKIVEHFDPQEYYNQLKAAITFRSHKE